MAKKPVKKNGSPKGKKKMAYKKQCDHCSRPAVYSAFDEKLGKMVGLCQRHFDQQRKAAVSRVRTARGGRRK